MIERLEKLQQFLNQSPGEPFLMFAIAKEYEGIDLAKSLSAYLTLRDQHPAYTGLYYHLGKLYEAMNQPEKAVETYDAGIEIARSQQDRHAQNELMAARADLTGGDEF